MRAEVREMSKTCLELAMRGMQSDRLSLKKMSKEKGK
jgi:hypothetical protein